MVQVTRAGADLEATNLGHESEPWRWVDTKESFPEEPMTGSITACRNCWRDMVVVRSPTQMMIGPMLEERCDDVGGEQGQRRLFP